MLSLMKLEAQFMTNCAEILKKCICTAELHKRAQRSLKDCGNTAFLLYYTFYSNKIDKRFISMDTWNYQTLQRFF